MSFKIFFTYPSFLVQTRVVSSCSRLKRTAEWRIEVLSRYFRDKLVCLRNALLVWGLCFGKVGKLALNVDIDCIIQECSDLLIIVG